jgi:hypothetical protein
VRRADYSITAAVVRIVLNFAVWTNDHAVKLAKGLRAGLDAVHVAPHE